ncbi:MAG: ATP-binding protein [Solibacillus sp.]
MTKLTDKNIRSQFLKMLFAIVFVFSIVILGFYVYVKSTNEHLSQQREELSDKAKIVSSMEESFSDIFFRARGYYAFKNNDELQQLYSGLNLFEMQLKDFGRLDLTVEELELYDRLETFTITYREQILPEAIGYVETDNYEALQQLSNGGANSLVNEFIAYAKEYNNQTEVSITQLFNEIIEQAQFYTLLYIVLGAGLLLVIGLIMQRVISNLILPIEKLTAATNSFVTGHYVDINVVREREDELGALARSFYDMTISIQDKEEELTTQNEELTAQQDELQANQAQLQTSLNQLEKFNKLNHVLTFTLDKQQLLTNLHTYVRDVYKFDTSILYLVDTQDFSVKGMTEQSAHQLMRNLHTDKKVRLEEEKSFVIKREMLQGHETIAQQSYFMYDLYTAVLNSEGKLVAVMMATREGHMFTNQELLDINGLMNQASIAFERIFMYEEVERSRKLNQKIIDTVNEGIQFVSKVGEVVVMNQALSGIIHAPTYEKYEHTTQQSWLQHFQAIVDEPEAIMYFLKNAIIEDFGDTRTMRYRISQSLSAASFIEVYATSVYESDAKIGTMFVHRDITAEYEVDQMKSELVSTVSHELRTPLSSILGFTELLLTKELKQERQQKYIETIHKEAKRLTNLINDFLDLQRMESGRQTYTMEPFVLGALADDIIKNFQHEKNHTITLINEAINDRIIGDKERLTQLFINIIGNAIKFSPSGGEIQVKLENKVDQVVISIQDEGIGIPKDAITSLFQKFKRIDNSARRKIGGTGLGLALSKEIALQHNGTIWIESEEGEGTTVFVGLPLHAQQSIKHFHEQAPQDKQGNYVMIVEDDLSSAILLAEELKTKGFLVLYQDDPQKALEEALHIPLIGIVIDLMFGDKMKGWDLVHELRAHEQTKDLPIVISSALDEAKEKVEQYQITKYFTKPFMQEELSRVLLAAK